MKSVKLLLSAVLIACMATTQSSAKVTLHPLFTDNMVLQQQSEVNIWGSASPNKKVRIFTSWNNAEYEVFADAEGKWTALISTPKAGGPYTISVSDGKKPEVLENVLVGEVWICSGQSNMEMKIGDKVTGYEQEMANALKYADIRLLHIENRTSPKPLDAPEIRYGGWQTCSGENIFDFSAAAYFFGQHLNENLDVPVGLIETCWGGTYAESWTSAEGLSQMPFFHERLEKVKTLPESREGREQIFREEMEKWRVAMSEAEDAFYNGRAVWSEPAFDASSWTKVRVPDFLQDQGMGSTSGFFWLRKTFDIPAEWSGKEIKLELGVIDDNDFTYFNGVEVGHTEGCLSWRTYAVPAELVKSGKAAIAIRVMDTGGKGGIVGDAASIAAVGPDGKKIVLSGDWGFKMSFGLADCPEIPVNTATEPNYPTFLYNAMINPLVDYRIRGAIWYQGEANVARADQYRELMPLMINDWREKWGYDFPFYIAQLANFMTEQTGAEESEWAELREAQSHTLHLENTGMAVLIDIGEAGDIHPKNKKEVGRRLALNALALTYGKNVPYSGPVCEDYRIEENSIRIMFSHTEGGLVARDGSEVQGFYIAGPDRVFHKAVACIEGNSVVVNSDKVSFPVAVRYGWANNPVCNLYNGAGLPASPFRTDKWSR
mgnify:CR=1 FL=1